MRYAIISDIHANAAALARVLDSIRAEGADRILCLGDIVGNHTSPGECIEMLMESSALCVAGNHDEGVRGTLGPGLFPAGFWKTVLWTRDRLTSRQMGFLRGLPRVSVVDGRFLLMHGMMHQSHRYLVGDGRFRSVAARMMVKGIRFGLYGHTHLETCLRLTGRTMPWRIERLRPDDTADVSAPGWYLINPGTVGHPRTRDIRAKYALLDTQSGLLERRFIEYDYGDVLLHTLHAFPLSPLALGWGG
jgi:predicted phosphodiesterase